jgi:hypothetical protein
MADLSRLTIRGARAGLDTASGAQVFHVDETHALTQAAGYLKHVCKADENIFFRGQSKLYSTLCPSLFREKGQQGQAKAISGLQRVIKEIESKSPIFHKFNRAFYEPLLQHYGLKTTWLDLVDNVWVALWFACHNALTGTKVPKYLHFEKRDPYKEGAGSYVYILMIGTDRDHTRTPGFFKGPRTELVDLRVGCPSVFVRPHAQHGVLFRLKGNKVRRPSDYSNAIRGIIRVDLQQALTWLGDGNLLNTHSLMPPAYYDEGYRILLDLDLPADPDLGTIQHIGA